MMTVEAIAALTAASEPEMILPAGLPAAQTTNFGNWFSTELADVNDKLVRSDREIQTLAMGGTLNLHEVMIHLEEARLSFQLLAQVRNRLLEAYQEVMRMQI
jgi:flagellar hook-basal body complex protein FliE